MSLHLYNTLTRELERFKPLRQEEVKVYYCGPTPYNYAHIGNLRNYLMDDIVVRTLRFLGYKVKTVMNITDIDDKTIRDSQKSWKTLKEFTEFYTKEFLTDCGHLHITPADTIAPISTFIPEMGTMIDGLLKKWFAYLAEDGSIYYSVSKFKKYGQLANLDMKGMISSVRINNDEYDKEQVADFALWKAYDETTDGPNFWEIEVSIPQTDEWSEMGVRGGDTVWTVTKNSTTKSKASTEWVWLPTETFDTFGHKSIDKIVSKKIRIKGRPGWHIECSACNMKYFGAQIDIHMGGCDLVFPHHQNEIAQSEAFTGKTFSKYWMHGGHLLVDNKKMAKSANNFYTLRDIFEKNKELPEALVSRGIRLMSLQNQYHENFNFTFDRLGAAINTIKGLDEMMKRIGRYTTSLPETNDERSARGKLKFHDISRDFRENQQVFMQEFVDKLEDDFDTNSAMTIVFEYQSYINRGIDEQVFRMEEMKSLIDLMKSWDEVIAILDFSLLENIEIIPKEIEALGLARAEAKTAKNWWEADKLRDELTSLGWKMIDEVGGKWRVEKI
jgi:cysteinyl-tRNA synthetase